jgi:hypothetical protein
MLSRPEFKWWDALFAVLGSLLIAVAWLAGLVTNLMNVLLIASIPIAIVTRVWAGIQGQLETGFIRRPFAPNHRWFLLQVAVRWVFLAVWVLALRSSIVAVQLGDALRSVWIILGLAFFVLAIFPLLPKKRILASRLMLTFALAMFFGGQLILAGMPPATAEVFTMSIPLRNEALVFQGGRSPLLNHHFLLRSQRNALDLVVLKNGKLFDGSETDLSSHGCFGEPIHAPLSGTVVKVVNDRPDMAYGKVDQEQIVGNHVVLQVAPERFVLFAHLKQGSAAVREGEGVKCGTVLAQCGNSGNTSAPHLHVQVQNRAEFAAPDLRTYPIAFQGVIVARGAENHETPLVLRRNDRVRPKGEMCQSDL